MALVGHCSCGSMRQMVVLSSIMHPCIPTLGGFVNGCAAAATATCASGLSPLLLIV